MASVTARLSMMGESGYGEPEKDANSVSIELDKGLRSTKIGEQCEAIVRYPRLFEKYPFPIRINSAFLKLADVFRVGSNFLRLCFLKVSQQSQKHLDKIINVDEFIRPIFSVIHSNDPVARAITLRTLGSMAAIIPDRKNAHHSIISSLDSHDSVEIEAAIYAANHFAAQSKTFAHSICSKLAEMIQGLATPEEMKLKLIPIFQHMHHDSQTATKVRQLCAELLERYPARGMVLVTLHTLSQLSAKSLMDIPQQVELLLSYLQTDPRKSIKVQALRDLKMLAKKGSHMWNTSNMEALCAFTLSTSYDGFKTGGLDVLTTLSSTIAVSNFRITDGSPVLEVCTQCCFHGNIIISSKALQLLTDLAVHSNKAGTEPSALCQEAARATETLIIIISTETSNLNTSPLKTCLKCVVSLSSSCRTLIPIFVQTIMASMETAGSHIASLMCECLAALGSRHAGTLTGCLPELCHKLQQHLREQGNAHDQKMIVILCTLIFQTLVDKGLSPEMTSLVLESSEKVGGWLAYQIARQAARYGHHRMAAQIFDNLASKVSSEQVYFWLNALKALSLGEKELEETPTSMSEFLAKISQAGMYHHKAIVALKAASTTSNTMSFQCDYIQLRASMLQALGQLVKANNSFKSSPPPAIAASLAMSTGQEMTRCGHVIAQLKQCCRQFEELREGYTNLYQSSFDADHHSLNHLQILQQCCHIMANSIDAVINRQTSRERVDFQLDQAGDLPIEHRTLLEACEDVAQLVQTTCHEAPTNTITYHHINCLLKAAVTIVRAPVCMPRYFFQTLQTTIIKLAISPQPRSANDPISVEHDTHLTLKVEGVIQHADTAGILRSTHKINLSVNSVLQMRTQLPTNPNEKLPENVTNDMHQVVEPHNDYFTCQFLLSFPAPGLHVVNIEAAVVDESGGTWRTGPCSSINVKSYDEVLQRQQQYARSQVPRPPPIASASQF